MTIVQLKIPVLDDTTLSQRENWVSLRVGYGAVDF